MGQKWAKNKTVFTKQYLSLLDYLQTKNTNIIVIPPLILGENLNNSWNKEIEELVGIIKIIIQDYPKAFYLDIRSSFINYIKDKEQSDYIPYKVFALYTDLKNLKTNEDVDKKSQERGLYLTLDGVHINSKGANIIAEEIITQINKY
jgi:lysophospholipase L1-like esterase